MIDQNKAASDIQSTLEQGENRLKAALSQAESQIKQGREQVTKWAADIDKKAHENPWPLIAGVGVGCLLLGVILGKSRS